VPLFAPTSRRQAFIEIALIFAVFCIQGAWPVPDVNEPYYLGKAIHFWNSGWLRGDFFLETADSHKVFYFTFGWLSLWLTPTALAWTGRILTWLLLAWAWRRLSWAVVPRRWCSVLSAALFVCLSERCHMAGEWVIGGVEAKGFAYVLVFLGLEALVRNRWNRALLLIGAATAFHVLAGGWVAVAVGLAWLWLKRPRHTACGFAQPPPLHSLYPGIVGGLLLALPGIIPSLMLDWGVDANTSQAAHQIYVFERLPHHLVLSGIRPEFVLRLTLLWVFWLLLGWWDKGKEDVGKEDDGRGCVSRLRAFVTGAVTITLVGVAIQPLICVEPGLAATLLRYYWFRLTDVALPLGVALESVALIVRAPRVGRRCWLALAILVAAFHLSDRMLDRIAPAPPRSNKMADFEAWREACEWVATSGKIPSNARFLVPRHAQTFRWYANRSDVANWKDVPQDAKSIVQWWDRIRDIYATGQDETPWYGSLADLSPQRLRELGAKYRADYAISELTEPPLGLDVAYRNRYYVIYRLH
jgi:hypothetical protein